MAGVRIVKERQRHAEQAVPPWRWQPRALALVEIHGERQKRGAGGPRVKKAHAARLDQAPERRRRVREEPVTRATDGDAVIGDEGGAAGEALEGQPRLA